MMFLKKDDDVFEEIRPHSSPFVPIRPHWAVTLFFVYVFSNAGGLESLKTPVGSSK